MRPYSNSRFFIGWALAFAAGVLAMLYAPGAWPALGALIVIPTILTVLLMAYGYVAYKITERLGGNPKGDWFGMFVFLSFAFFWLPLVVAYLRHHRQ